MVSATEGAPLGHTVASVDPCWPGHGCGYSDATVDKAPSTRLGLAFLVLSFTVSFGMPFACVCVL
jgi:hypothetical protein